MIVVDGSFGEGGGQILRYTLALASVLGKPVRIINIRAKRENPGLQRQHLTVVRALAEITGAKVKGAALGSTEVEFEPKRISGGSYFFDIGSAGSITLVLQSLLLVAAFSEKPIEFRLVGGTDVPWSPTYDYFKHVFLYHLSKVGYNVELELIRRGHYPRGGGEVIARVRDPPKGFKPLNLSERGGIIAIRGISHAVRLPRHVAERQARAAREKLLDMGIKAPIEIEIESYPPDRDPHIGQGSGIALWADTSNTRIGADSIGARDKRAEEVGIEAAFKLANDILTGASLDTHMSDMIIPYLILSKGSSEVTCASLTLHAYTVIEISKKIVEGINIEYDGSLNKPFRIRVSPASYI
ncbi:MAG: RNA 3'-terminal phosphate cyclase [Desulfurococcales archaeon]|nr:RNA 3'-terminal phosphate cyclase [Desulfurococcales archaeon]